MDKRNASSGLKQVCATVNRDVVVIESKTLDEITRNDYWNELKLLLHTTEQPHGDGSSRHCYSSSLYSSLLSKVQTVLTFALCDMHCPPQ